jgi:ankyrin repeat protein
MKHLHRLLLVLSVLGSLPLQAMNSERQEQLNQQLLRAIQKGDVPNVTALLQAGADVNAQGPSGNTPLHLAADQGHVNVAILLLEHGAYVDQANWHGETPLYWTVAHGHAATVYLLNLFGTPLMQAFRTNPTRYLEEHPLDERTLDATPLHFAVLCNKPAIVTALLKEKVAILAGDARNHSPLLYALWFGHTAVAQELINTLAQQRAASVLGALTLGKKNRCALSYIAQKDYCFLNYLITHHQLLTQPNND